MISAHWRFAVALAVVGLSYQPPATTYQPYIRREWGQTGTPVDPGQVKAVRTETATRTRPWTHDELMALVKAP